MTSRPIDGIDRRIIDELRNEARLSWRELASRVFLAPTSVADRVRSLERSNVIRKYRAEIDPAALGLTVRAVIETSLPNGMSPEPFEERLNARDEVALAVYVTGASDYVLIVDCHDSDGLDAFVRWLRCDVGVSRTETSVVLRTLVG